MKAMWNERYSAPEYAYGTEGNAFFKASLEKYQPQGKILLPAEGEGRNAVYAAKKGLEVTAFDISEAGRQKALQLAQIENVEISYEVGDFLKMDFAENSFDVSALIYAHFPSHLLGVYHQRIAGLLKAEGLLILEGFSKNHLPLRKANPKVGGPDKIEMLFSVERIREDFSDLRFCTLPKRP